jgi:hypothetical protein
VTHAYNPSTREAVRKEDLEFEANLGYIRRLCLQEKKKKTSLKLQKIFITTEKGFDSKTHKEKNLKGKRK